MRQKYETDLTDEQWDVIAPLFSNMRKYKWEKVKAARLASFTKTLES